MRGPMQFGRLPLHWAMQGGHFEVVEVLLKKGSPIDVLDSVRSHVFARCRAVAQPRHKLCGFRLAVQRKPPSQSLQEASHTRRPDLHHRWV